MIKRQAEESYSGYYNSLENCNPSRGSWVRVPPPPQIFKIVNFSTAQQEPVGNFLDELLNKVGIKIVHIKTAYHYNLNEVLGLLN